MKTADCGSGLPTTANRDINSLHRRLAARPAPGADTGRRSRPGLPRCTGGRRAGPPEGCGGVWAFLEQTQPHHVLDAAIRAAEILGMLLDDEGVPRFGEHRDELAGLLPLLGVDRFDRRTLNRALAAHAAAQTRARAA